MFALRNTRIRTRLLIAYVGTLLLGFVALAFASGQQIASSARADYERQLANEIRLIAQSISAQAAQMGADDSLEALVAAYSPQVEESPFGGDGLSGLRRRFSEENSTPINGTLRLVNPTPEAAPDQGDRNERPSFRDQPELETALRGETIVVSRNDESGEPALFTAAALTLATPDQGSADRTDQARGDEPPMPLLQLSVPLAALNEVIAERWAVLLLICLLVTGAALIVALVLARSIIQPLNTLRDSARVLSQGDLSHRVAYDRPDEIGEVARAFNDMAQQVQSMLEEQRAFASNTSHELRTPLTAIRLRTEALRDEPQLDPTLTQQYIAEIDDEVRRLGDLIEDLTLLSRFDAGRAELGQNEFDLVQVAHSLRQRLQAQAEAKGITLTIDSSGEIALVRASLTHLTIVFRNLLDNAIKYTPAGSVAWQIQAEGDNIVSTIRDTGVGLTPEQLPHLFERFYRADKARSRSVPGTGLGLTIAQSIVEAYGGSMRVTSAGPDLGTTVTVVWPRAG